MPHFAPLCLPLFIAQRVLELSLVTGMRGGAFRQRFRDGVAGAIAAAKGADAAGIERNDDAFAVVELDYAVDVVGGLVPDRRRRRLELVPADSGHLAHTIHQQTGSLPLDINHQHAAAVGVLFTLHSESGSDIEDRQYRSTQTRDAFDIVGSVRQLGHLRQTDDFLHRHDVEAELFILE